MRRKAFTIPELLVAFAVIGILAGLSTATYSTNRRNARDAQRKQGARLYLASITSYQATAGTYFLVSTGTSGNRQTSIANCVSAVNDPNLPAATVPTQCAGANGRSYGMLNAKDGSVNSAVAGWERTYAPSRSMAETLVSEGYLSKVVRDPKASTSAVPTTQPDFVLVRCCVNGIESRNVGGSLVAVATRLERDGGSEFDVSSSKKYCGGSEVLNGVPQFDFGTPLTSDFFTEYTNYYAVGSGAVTSTSAACNEPGILN